MPLTCGVLYTSSHLIRQQVSRHLYPLRLDGLVVDDGDYLVRSRWIVSPLDSDGHPQHFNGRFHFRHFRLQAQRLEVAGEKVPRLAKVGLSLPVLHALQCGGGGAEMRPR